MVHITNADNKYVPSMASLKDKSTRSKPTLVIKYAFQILINILKTIQVLSYALTLSV